MVKKKASRYVSTLPPFEFEQPTVMDMGYQHPEFVKCRISSTSVSSPLNFDWPAVPTDVTLANIKDAICKRHGGTAMDLVLYRDQAKPECKLQDDDEGASLKSLGVRGIVSGPQEELPLVSILYDFKAAGQDDAIVLVDGNQVHSKFNLSLKTASALRKSQLS